jgi:hypothetical protein
MRNEILKASTRWYPIRNDTFRMALLVGRGVLRSRRQLAIGTKISPAPGGEGGVQIGPVESGTTPSMERTGLQK